MSHRWYSEPNPAPAVGPVGLLMLALLIVGMLGLAATDQACRDHAGTDRTAVVECDRLAR